MPQSSLPRRLAAEAIGTAFLLAAVIGSGIMAERLCGGNIGLTLLANTIATGAALVALILALGGISGAHINPAVTLAFALRREFPWREVVPYVLVQCLAAFGGAALAHLMFDLPLFTISANARTGPGQWLGEAMATFGLVLVIFGCVRRQPGAVAYAVGAYITAAYWFTSSTSFANPAVTLARAVSDTFAGIRPSHAPAFLGAQMLGAIGAAALYGWLDPKMKEPT